MEKSSWGIDVKGWGLLGMKRTQPLKGRSGLFQIDSTGTDQAKNVSCLRNPTDKIFAECHNKIMSSLQNLIYRDDFKPRFGMKWMVQLNFHHDEDGQTKSSWV